MDSPNSELWHHLRNSGFPALKLFTLKVANTPIHGQCGQETAVSEPTRLNRAVLSEEPTGLCRVRLGFQELPRPKDTVPKRGCRPSKIGKTGMNFGHVESKMRQLCSALDTESLGSGQ